MKAYCINLDRRPDRLAHMTAEFAKAGIPFERIPAVDGQDPDVAAAAARLPMSRLGIRISAGAYGCLQSHRLFWQRVIDSGDRWGLVFEDDLLLASDLAEVLSDEWVPDDTDVVKLETFGVRIHISQYRKRILGKRSLAILRSTHLGTGAYVISARMAEQLLEVTENSGDPIDEFLFNERLPFFSAAKIYQMIPAPALQGDRTGKSKAKHNDGWQATSIVERKFGVLEPKGTISENKIQRVLRRGREELRALQKGTRYVVVPHG